LGIFTSGFCYTEYLSWARMTISPLDIDNFINVFIKPTNKHYNIYRPMDFWWISFLRCRLPLDYEICICLSDVTGWIWLHFMLLFHWNQESCVCKYQVNCDSCVQGNQLSGLLRTRKDNITCHALTATVHFRFKVKLQVCLVLWEDLFLFLLKPQTVWQQSKCTEIYAFRQLRLTHFTLHSSDIYNKIPTSHHIIQSVMVEKINQLYCFMQCVKTCKE